MRVLKCPKCGREVEGGCVTLALSENAWLYWPKEKLPGFFEMMKGKKVEHEAVMEYSTFGKKQKVSRGSRCVDCRLILFAYRDQHLK
jgi:hypothetical protein